MIVLKNIHKHYKMGDIVVKALDGVNLHINEGEFTAIVGPSGSGKSTLMNIIGCLDLATEGEYVLNNTPIRHYQDYQLADIRNKQIGFVFQQFNLLPHLSALENIEVPLSYAKVPRQQRHQRARHLLASVGLSDRVKHKPTELSGGQQQRVSIARALANNPAIILADEPTGALDSRTGRDVLNLLKDLNATGKTIVIITHDINVAKNAQRIITIRDGRIVSETGGQI